MTYKEALFKAIDGWNSDPIEDEWLFEKFREDFVRVMSPPDAFSSISITIDCLLSEFDESTAIEILQTIIVLADRSDTTECPSKLIEKRSCLEEKFSVFGDYAKSKLRELFRHYRLQ